MDALLNNQILDETAAWATQLLLDSAMMGFYVFTLVLARMSGLMTIGPIFGQSVVPANFRVMLVLTTALIIAPTQHNQNRLEFLSLDANADGFLSRDEMPAHRHDHFEELLARSGKAATDRLTLAEFQLPPQFPSSLVNYAWVIVGEFALGGVLGLGMFIILSGLQMAGHFVDQQTGIALGEVFNPGLDMSSSLSGQMLYMLGVTVLLVMEPVNGHLMILSALIETFQTVPVGHAFVSTSAIVLLRDLVHQSLVLALQVAAPIMATMSLVALSMGFLGHTVPQVNVLVIGFAVRAMVSLSVLALTISGAAAAMVEVFPYVIDELRRALASA